MSRNVLGDPVRLAFGTLTVLRVPPPRVVDRRVAGRAMLLAPLTAVFPALTAALVILVGGRLHVPALACGALAVGALALASRGLHLDGLADTADGLAASYDRGRALAVMRSGDVGPAGVVTVLVVLMTQAASTAALSSTWRGTLGVIVAVISSRAVLAMGCGRTIRSARPDGLGASVAGTVPWAAAAASAATVTAAASVVLALTGRPWWLGALAVLVAFAAAAVVLLRCLRRLGGVTGDVLGACVEVALTGALVVLATHPPS